MNPMNTKDEFATYNGLILSYREVKFPKYIPPGYTYNVPRLHPFSLIFITFRPKIDPFYPDIQKWEEDEEKTNSPGFFADKELLFSLLHCWGVTLDD